MHSRACDSPPATAEARRASRTSAGGLKPSRNGTICHRL
jgi:hypothetical protein